MADTKNDKNSNSPALRFPGFTEPWQKTQISTICDVLCGYAFDGNSIVEYKTPHKLLRGVNITEGVIRHTSDLDRYIAGVLDVKLDKYILHDGDLVIGMDGSKVGKNTAIITKKDSGTYLVQRVCRLRADSTIISLIFHQINNPIFHKYVDNVKTSSAIPHISQSDILNYYISFTSNPSERDKIVNLLNSIDKRIATQRRLIEDLEKLRYAIRNKLFQSIQGKNLPLENVADIIKGKQLNSEFLMKSGSYYVMNGGIEPSGYYHTFNVSSNTISISEGGNSCGYVQWNNTPFWSGGHCYTLNIKDRSIEDKYLYHFLKWREADIMKLRIGTGLPNIQKKDLARVTIEIPTSSLQTKIICLLDFYNAKIENETYVLELYNRQKLYLLSQMFI